MLTSDNLSLGCKSMEEMLFGSGSILWKSNYNKRLKKRGKNKNFQVANLKKSVIISYKIGTENNLKM
jgi:hypothetical protein